MRAGAITLAGGAAVLGMVGMANAQAVQPVATSRSGEITMNHYDYTRSAEDQIALSKLLLGTCLDCAAHGLLSRGLAKRSVTVSRFDFTHESGQPFVLAPEMASGMLSAYCQSQDKIFRPSARGSRLGPKALPVHSISGSCQ